MKTLFLLTAGLALNAQDHFRETLYPEWTQSFEVSKMIYAEKSDYWDLVIFENPILGRVLAIDGTIQITEKDEAIYQEMMTHPPILAHGHAKSVLIIGGGDGGALREVLRHQGVKKATLVEIDPQVIEISKKFLPAISRGAFEDPRAEIVIQDASRFIKETPHTYDIIICDSSDPIGPGKVLFTSEFYADCKAHLNPRGIFVNQNGVPFMQKEELALTLQNRSPHFQYVTFYTAAVPTYIGGLMALGWASDEDYTNVSAETLQERLSQVEGKMKYYTPQVHKASFALPQYMLDE